MDMTATLTDQLYDARAMHAEGVRLQKVAADMLRDVARQLRDAGWKGKDIAPALGVNQQRVSQLLAVADQDRGPDKKNVRRLAAKGNRPDVIAARLGLSVERVSQLLAHPS